MVVSCQKEIVCFLLFLCIAIAPTAGFAVPQELSDAELDEITAANLPEELTRSLQKILASLGSALDPGVLGSAGLVQIHAVNSDVAVQTNILVISVAEGVNIELSNVYTSPGAAP